MIVEEFLEKWVHMCFQCKGCKHCPAHGAEERGYKSCIDWGLFHYELMVPYVYAWKEIMELEGN